MRKGKRTSYLLTLLLLLSSCEFRANLLSPGQDSAPLDSAPEDASRCGSNDQDLDGITTEIEGTLDLDNDGLGNHQDRDSDADGFPDDVEVGDDPCYPQDTDGDGRPDFIDFDSDGDGLRDEDEVDFGTDRLLVDSDGDGQSDAVEFALGTQGNDRASLTQDAAVSAMPASGEVELDLRIQHEKIDITLLVENTIAARPSITAMAEGFTPELVSRLEALGADTRIGVATFADYPTSPFGVDFDRPASQALPISAIREDLRRPPTEWSPGNCVDFSSLPYSERILYGLLPILDGPTTMTPSAANGTLDFIDALLALPCFGGGDPDGSQLFAIRALSSLSILETWSLPPPSMGQGSTFPRDGCPGFPLDRGMGCMRTDASRLIIMVGVGDIHGADRASMETGSAYPFSGSILGGALTLTANGISLAGLRIASPPTEDDGYTTLARESETTDSDGSPLVHHNPVLSEASGLVVDLAERWATQTSVALGHARVAASTLNIEGARSAASLLNAEALREQVLGRTAPGEIRPIMLSVTAPPIDQRGRYPIAYTVDLIAPRSTTYFPRSSTPTACISTLDCGPNEVCSREECSLTSTGARTRVAWVLPAQSDTPSP